MWKTEITLHMRCGNMNNHDHFPKPGLEPQLCFSNLKNHIDEPRSLKDDFLKKSEGFCKVLKVIFQDPNETQKTSFKAYFGSEPCKIAY